jgi:hypothetical protein
VASLLFGREALSKCFPDDSKEENIKNIVLSPFLASQGYFELRGKRRAK